MKRCKSLTLPNLIVIGAAKSGTTSLYHYLAAHPEIYLAEPKDLNFFITTSEFPDGHGYWSRGLDWYKKKVEKGADNLVRGEISPAYTYSDLAAIAAPRIHKVIPHAKIAYIMRSPLERVRSDYLQHLYQRRIPEHVPLDEILKDGFSGKAKWEKFFSWAVETSLYYKQMSHYLNSFSEGQIHWMTFESMRSDPKAAIRRLFEFLEVDPEFIPSNLGVAYNQTKEKYVQKKSVVPMLRRLSLFNNILNRLPESKKKWRRKLINRKLDDERLTRIGPKNKDRLLNLFGEDVERLRRVTGHNFSEWDIK